MKASELRIGNWVKIINQNGIIKDFDAQIECADITRIFDQCFNVWNYEPIPLTEERILSFGFDDNFKQFDFENNGLKVVKDIHSDSWIFYIGFLNNFYQICLIKHVHQLQNLYFALTGEELTLKITTND